jgi:HTH-type transcriptional regulator/antitoxin HipB
MRKPSTPEATRITSADDLGKLVRAVRHEAGLDQSTAAGIAGVGVRFLGDIERGKPTVRFDLVLQVLHRLGLELTISPRAGTKSKT